VIVSRNWNRKTKKCCEFGAGGDMVASAGVLLREASVERLTLLLAATAGPLPPRWHQLASLAEPPLRSSPSVPPDGDGHPGRRLPENVVEAAAAALTSAARPLTEADVAFAAAEAVGAPAAALVLLQALRQTLVAEGSSGGAASPGTSASLHKAQRGTWKHSWAVAFAPRLHGGGKPLGVVPVERGSGGQEQHVQQGAPIEAGDCKAAVRREKKTPKRARDCKAAACRFLVHRRWSS
jgi:hypothetical protein